MTARHIAFEVLLRVEQSGAFASRALDAALSSAGALEEREAGLATELVYGTLRRAHSLDGALVPFCSRPLAKLDPAARVALRMGAYQLLFLGTPPHAAVGETVALVKKVDHGRAAGFVNAVLRALSREPRLSTPPPQAEDPAGHLAVKEALPRWLAAEWVEWLGVEEATQLAAAMNQPAPLVVRSPERDALIERALAAGLEASPTPRSPHGVVLSGASVQALARAAGGLPFQVQDEAAQLATLYAVGPLIGQKARVLDSCAAPGGKTFHLAEILGPGSELVAVELHPRKADTLRRDARARGLNVTVICADASRPLPGLEPGSFDAVLVDAPCAGLGTLRRHPELKLRRTQEDLGRFADLQASILSNCQRYARAGAPVTYSICSLSRTEGPRVVEAALAHGGRRSALPPDFPQDTLTADGDLLTLPNRHGIDGFYGARIVG